METDLVLLASSFNTASLAGYLENSGERPFLRVQSAPFGQVVPTLQQLKSGSWRAMPDVLVIWAAAQAVLPSFQEILVHKAATSGAVEQEVDRFADLILAAGREVRTVLVTSWHLPWHYRGLGLTEMKSRHSGERAMLAANLRLAERLEDSPNSFLLSSRLWLERSGRQGYVPKSWYVTKVPYGPGVFQQAAAEIKAALRALSGSARKALILDLDNTLWGGVVGEVGWENLRLGGHDPIGEAFVDFQNALKSLTRRGTVLGIVSKNEESTALEAINCHPEMVLALEDFAGWRINWRDKAENIAELSRELALPMDSMAFIDDNRFERTRVREALPQVFVPEWPQDPTQYETTLLSLAEFDIAATTEEDKQRSEMYAVERSRVALRSQVPSMEDWLRSLEMVVTVETPNRSNRKRMSQLFNKTNQMNMATRRLSEKELNEWLDAGNREMWLFRVSDRLGDLGITGIASLDSEDSREGRIVDFLLSCRVMGRGIEEAMLATVIQHARKSGLTQVVARYIPTEKNKPFLDFLERSGLHAMQPRGTFSWRVLDDYALPRHLELRKV